MKSVKRLLLAFFSCAFLFLILLPQARSVSLIRISKDDVRVWGELQRLQIDVRQELETCFLALADRKERDALDASRIGFSVLDVDAAGKDYVLVPLIAPEAESELLARGQAVAVEPGTAVFWSTEGAPLEMLPPGFPRKPLSSASVLPYLRPPIEIEWAAPPAFLRDPLIAHIVGRLSEAELRFLVQSLQDFQTRYATTPGCDAAGDFIHAAFSSFGLDGVRFDPFTFSGGYESRNVIAEIRGRTYPDDILIICGHYDSISPAETRLTLAPGADDNASGAAVVIEAARILSAFPLDFTVRFIAFSAEEWGLYGSRDYAAQARAAGESIIGVINLDMVAYADVMPEDLEVFVNGPSEWLAERLLAAASQYADLAARKRVDASMIYSDHSPFWDYGYAALLAIEDSPLQNPYYHRTTDTIDKLNFDFFAGSARAALALLAELAQPLREGAPRTPVGLTAAPIVYRSLFSTMKSARLSWSAQSDAAGYNVYRTNVSHLSYTKINDSLVAGTSFLDQNIRTEIPYFYVVTAVGNTGIESNRSREAAVAGGGAASASRCQNLGFFDMMPGGK